MSTKEKRSIGINHLTVIPANIDKSVDEEDSVDAGDADDRSE